MYDSSELISDLYSVDLQYEVPSTDYLIFNWADIGSGNPVYTPLPTDYFVVDFTPHQGPQSIGQVLVYDGSFFDANEHITDLGAVSFYDGESASINVKTTAIAYLQPVFYDGSQEFSNLSTTVVLTGDGPLVASDGSASTSALTIHTSGPIGTAIGYEGSTLAPVNLGVTLLLQATFSDGATLVYDLDTCPGCNSSSVEFYDGSFVTSDLASVQSMSSVFYDGATDITVFSTFPAWREANPIFEEGSSLFFDMATTVNLTGDGPLVNAAGEAMVTVFTRNPPFTPVPVFYAGEELDSSLATKIALVDVLYDGTEMDVVFTANPPASLSINLYDGSHVSSYLAAQQSLPVLIGYEGSTMALPAIANLENYYFYDGTEVDSSLSTTVVFTDDGPLVNGDGSYQFTYLTVSPAQPLANQWPIFTGETLSATLSTSQHAEFAAVIYGSVAGFQLDFSTSTHAFDLAKQCAVAQPDNYFYWKDPDVHWFDLTNHGVQAQPGAVTTGFSSYMNVTIAFKETLSPKPMYEGSTAGIYNFWPLLEVQGEIGFGMAVLDLKFDLDIPLCFGNFIPDGNHVDAELSTIDDTSCSVDQAYDGSFMHCVLENNIQEATVMYDGTYSVSTLTVPSAWVFQFYDGSRMYVPSQVDFSFKFYSGEFLTVQFAPWQITFFDGTHFIAPPPNTDYTVEFLEVGCLPNEYTDATIVDFNPFGAPPTANVELKPFFHQIQAECF